MKVFIPNETEFDRFIETDFRSQMQDYYEDYRSHYYNKPIKYPCILIYFLQDNWQKITGYTAPEYVYPTDFSLALFMDKFIALKPKVDYSEVF